MLTALCAAAADTMTGVFDHRVRTLQVYGGDNPLSMPVIVDGPGGGVTVEFDILADEHEYLRYSLTHCNARWQPSGLSESEYLDGFNEAPVEDWEYSRATATHYVHYRIMLPNEQMMPLLSGNYLLKVYPESDPDRPLLQCRIMVSEQTAPVWVSGSVTTDVDYMGRHQQISVSVDTERAGVEDIFNDLIVVVGQNGRLDSEVAVVQPLKVTGRVAHYEHNQRLIFPAGKEYRRFETVNENYPTMGVADIRYLHPFRHYILETDYPRDEQPYEYDQSLAGGYVIRRQGSAQSELEADYGVVEFALETPYMPGVEVFVDGDMALRRFDENSHMIYNHATGCYELAMLLKQGQYSYQYLAVPRGARQGSTAQLEGDSYRTQNVYHVRVYTRRRGERYDRLIGVGSLMMNTDM